MNFNEKLQKLRKEKKYSQEELADMLDVTRQSVSKWESGQTYPEMDKLLAICKIFGCTLEELTNDTIKLNEFTGEKKSKVSDITSSIEEYINKTYHYFAGSSFKDIVKCFIIMLVVYVILTIANVPFRELRYGLYNFFNSFMSDKVLGFTCGFFNLIINILYYSLKLFVLAYVFKIGFLDKKDDSIVLNESADNAEEVVEEKVNAALRTKKRYSIFDGLVSIVMFFIKTFFLIGAIPLVCLFVFLAFALIISIYFMFRGIFFISIFIGLVSAIMLNEIALEFIFNFIFDRKQAFRRILITLLASFAALGAAGGIFLIEASKYTYYNEASRDTLASNDSTYTYNSKLYLDSDLLNYYDVSFVEDDELDGKVNVSVIHGKYGANYDVRLDTNKIYLTAIKDNESFSFREFIDIFVKDLKGKKIYNYSLYGRTKVVISSSKKCLSVIKNNSEIESKKVDSEIENLKINQYLKRISELEEKVGKLESDNYTLNEKINDYKRKISDLSL